MVQETNFETSLNNFNVVVVCVFMYVYLSMCEDWDAESRKYRSVMHWGSLILIFFIQGFVYLADIVYYLHGMIVVL